MKNRNIAYTPDAQAATIFDRHTSGLSELVGESYLADAPGEVIAFPGKPLTENIKKGDLIINRALGEGNLAFRHIALNGKIQQGRNGSEKYIRVESLNGQSQWVKIASSEGIVKPNILIFKTLEHDVSLQEDDAFWLNVKREAGRIATQEWENWDRGNRSETESRMHARLLNYWRMSGAFSRTASDDDIKRALRGWSVAHNERVRQRGRGRLHSNTNAWYTNHAWSAAFISYVMHESGARSSFKYAAAHWQYMRAAKENRDANNTSNPFWLYELNEVRPSVGDLICNTRENSGLTFDNITTRSGFSHCDLVVDVDFGNNKVWVIGGNTSDYRGRRGNTVGKKARNLDASGFVRRQSGIFAILKIRTDSIGAVIPVNNPSKSGGGSSPVNSPTVNRSNAAIYNGKKSVELGWGRHLLEINRYLNLPQNTAVDSEILVRAVRQYQTRKGMTGRNVDGKLGPSTWSLLKSDIRNSARPSININLGKAADYNRSKSTSIGWGSHLAAINRYFNLPFENRTDSEALVRAVYEYQIRKGMTGRNVDGKLGPNTWELLQVDIGNISPIPVPPIPTPQTGFRANLARIVMEEWDAWGRGTKQENDPSVLEKLKEYYYATGYVSHCSVGNIAQQAATGRSAWSAAFISYVVKKAGGADKFRYSWQHWEYIVQAKRNRMENLTDSPFWLYASTEVKPEVGDIICKWRGSNPLTYDNVQNAAPHPSSERNAHCDIVTQIDTSGGYLYKIGGNISNSVSQDQIRLNEQGYIKNNDRYFAIIKVRKSTSNNVWGEEETTNTSDSEVITQESCACTPIREHESVWLKQIANRRRNFNIITESTPGMSETLPGPRPCCMLAPSVKPFSTNDNIANPASLGNHGSSSEKNGLIYCGKAGFVDLGHLRETCDLTKHIHDVFVNTKGAPMTVSTLHGNAVFHICPIGKLWLPLAMRLAYTDALGHEIMTYTFSTPGGHNSSFSPEDLCSNFLGVEVARRAISAGGSFNTAVTRELNRLLISLNAQSVTETAKAFNRINSRWVDFTGVSSLFKNDYLKRRNFTRTPWKTGHKSDATTPKWVTKWLLSSQSRIYTYTHTQNRKIPESSFAAEISKIRKDAQKTYGADYDKP